MYTGEDAVDASLPCQKCGYNLRGIRRSEKCPECGTKVSITLEGMAVESARREQAMESVRNYSKGYLFNLALGLVMTGCVGPVTGVIALIGCAQRYIALAAMSKSLPHAATGDTPEFRRAQIMIKVECVIGAVAMLFLSVGLSSVIGVIADRALRLSAAGLWIGVMALGMLNGFMLIDGIASRVAVRAERPQHVGALVFTAVPILMMSEILGALDMPAILTVALQIIGAGIWAAAAILLSVQGTLVAEELGTSQVKTQLRVPVDAAERQSEVMRSKPKQQRKPMVDPDDDAPIPLD